MRPFRILLCLLALTAAINTKAQDLQQQTVKLDGTALTRHNEGVPLHVLQGSFVEEFDGTIRQIKLPDGLPTMRECAYFFFRNETHDGELGIGLVADYKSPSPLIYFDANTNRDLTDDGAPQRMAAGQVKVMLRNKLQPNGTTALSFKMYTKEKEDKLLALLPYFPKGPKAEFTQPRYWLEMTPMVKVGRFRIDGREYTVGVYDNNHDGIISSRYEDADFYLGDRLLMAEGRPDTLGHHFEKQGFKIFEEVVSVGSTNIKVETIDSLGAYVKVSRTSLPPTVTRLRVGDKLGNFTYSTIEDNSQKELYSQKDNGKYKLIEFWGTWCKGCIQILPQLKSLQAEFGDKLETLSLNFNDSDSEKVKRFIREKGMTWQQGYSTLELNRNLGVQAFPYAILLDEDFRIVAVNTRPELVREYLAKAGKGK